MWRGGVLSLLAAASLVAGDDIGLVRVTDEWRYFRGVREPSDPPTAWRQPEFDDSAWARGPAGFTFASGLYEATSVADFAAPVGAVYCRRAFEVTDPAALTWLILRVDWSGGFAAFLNGREVARRNLPGDADGWTPHDFVPPSRDRTGPEELDLSAARGLLRPGRNVLAIQWHEHSSGGYASGLLPELLADCTRGPALEAAGPDRQTILWRSPFLAEGWVEYGPTPALGRKTPATPPAFQHVATLTNLTPDTDWYYRVVSRAGATTARSALSRFHSLKAEGPVEFMVVSDVGSGLPRQYRIARVLRAEAPDLVLMPGDLIHPAFREALADFRWYSVYGPLLRSTPFFVVAGNHDVTYTADHSFITQFAMPTNSVKIPEQPGTGQGPEGFYFYSFDHGDVHFAGLYAPIQLPAYALTPDSPQMQWLAGDLAASAKPWKFLFLHHPLMSSGPHGRDDYDHDGIPDPVEVARALLPLAGRYGVQLIFTGHDHLYERFAPVRGVQVLVSGAGGASVYPSWRREAASVQKWSRTHCLSVRVNGAELTARALDEQGGEFDRWYLRREPPAPDTVLEAARNTPDDGATLPADGDGNHVGQRFAFAGRPVGGVTGTFAHPGRLWVNVDETFLYLGLEAMELPEGDDALLFLALPGRRGVTTPAGLGNGRPPSAAEGVRALDRLEHLAFAPGFRPSVACVLGDEFADGTDRRFVRATAVSFLLPETENRVVTRPEALGQGVFWLRAGFPEVAGARVQQFNRSPQNEGVPDEQSANFAIVSLPLAELGLTGGERLQVGVVVARKDPPPDGEHQRRWLDRAFVGRSFTGGGFAASVLDGIPVQLPPLSAAPRLRARLRADGGLELSWLAVPGRRYRLETSPALAVPFQPADLPGQPRVATKREESWVVPGPVSANGAARFYRLLLLP
jgi:hypothetical protein